MIYSYSELLSYLEVEKKQKEVFVHTDTFPNGYIIKEIDLKTVLIKTKEVPTVNDIKILFFPFSEKFLQKVFKSLKEQEGVKNNDLTMV